MEKKFEKRLKYNLICKQVINSKRATWTIKSKNIKKKTKTMATIMATMLRFSLTDF